MTLGLAAGRVRLLSCHQVWAAEFRSERARVADVVGSYISDIQHVGSTAIPGVPAKPILDILVGVDDYDEAAVCIARLERIGYCYRGEHGIPRRHYFVQGDPRTHHLHMVERASEMWRVTVAFRDFLRVDSDSAREYAEAKVKLAAKYSRDRSKYQFWKDKIVERILERAVESANAAQAGR